MRDMQAGEKGMDTDSSRREMLGSSHELHEKSGHKPAGNMLHEDHAEDQMRHGEEKSHDHEQHKEMKTDDHEQHEGMKHQGHEAPGGKDHSNHHSHMLADFKKRFIVSFILGRVPKSLNRNSKR